MIIFQYLFVVTMEKKLLYDESLHEKKITKKNITVNFNFIFSQI